MHPLGSPESQVISLSGILAGCCLHHGKLPLSAAKLDIRTQAATEALLTHSDLLNSNLIAHLPTLTQSCNSCALPVLHVCVCRHSLVQWERQARTFSFNANTVRAPEILEKASPVNDFHFNHKGPPERYSSKKP